MYHGGGCEQITNRRGWGTDPSSRLKTAGAHNTILGRRRDPLSGKKGVGYMAASVSDLLFEGDESWLVGRCRTAQQLCCARSITHQKGLRWCIFHRPPAIIFYSGIKLGDFQSTQRLKGFLILSRMKYIRVHLENKTVLNASLEEHWERVY